MNKKDPLVRIKTKNHIYITVFLMLLLIASFTIFHFRAGPERKIWEEGIRNTLDLRLSTNDLLKLNEAKGSHQWIQVDLIDRDKEISRVKISLRNPNTLDFNINIDGTIYHLFKVDEIRRSIYNLFSRAREWDIDSSDPKILQLKINNVFVGFYIMEEKIYEQIRDPIGDYFVSLNSDIRLLNSIRTNVRLGKTKSLNRYFNPNKLARYLVFFSLFCFTDRPNFDHIIFKYNLRKKTFFPYLTITSIIISIKEHERTINTIKSNARLTQASLRYYIVNLLTQSKKNKYQHLIEVVVPELLKENE
jgi:hypothetical protein